MARPAKASRAPGRNGAAGAARREEIITVAARLFREKGYQSTSLDDVAEVIGFTKPAIYYYFRAKEDILFEINERIVDEALRNLEAIVERPGDPESRFREALETHLRTLLRNIHANAVFVRERGRLSRVRERKIRDSEREYAAMMEQIYTDGVASGRFADVPPNVAVGAILGACNWAFTWRKGGGLTEEELVETLLRLVTAGYLTH